MIFSRKTIKPIRQASQMTSLQDDDVMDIAKSMVPQTTAPKAVIPQSPLAQPASGGTSTMPKPMFFDNSQLTQIDTGKGAAARQRITDEQKASAIAGASAAQDSRVDTKRAAIDAAKAKAQETMATTGAANSREMTDGIDYNGDGVIGDPSTQAGRQMTQEDLINTAINQFLEPVDNTAARGAADEAMQQRSAEARQGARARMGMAGMGLTGAAAAAEGTEGRRGERERVLTMDEFDRNARKEQAERWLTGIGQSRESEVFKKIMEQLDKENSSGETADIADDNVVNKDELDKFEEVTQLPAGGKMIFSEDPNDPYAYFVTNDDPPKRVKMLKEDAGLMQANTENDGDGFWSSIAGMLGGK